MFFIFAGWQFRSYCLSTLNWNNSSLSLIWIWALNFKKQYELNPFCKSNISFAGTTWGSCRALHLQWVWPSPSAKHATSTSTMRELPGVRDPPQAPQGSVSLHPRPKALADVKNIHVRLHRQKAKTMRAHTNHQGKSCPVVFSNISFVCWFGKLSMLRAIFKKVQSYLMLLWKIHVRTIYMPIIRPTSLDGKKLQLRRIGYLLALRDQPIWSFVWLGLRFCWAYKFVLGIWSYFCWHWCMAFLMVIFYKNKLCQFCRRW